MKTKVSWYLKDNKNKMDIHCFELEIKLLSELKKKKKTVKTEATDLFATSEMD